MPQGELDRAVEKQRPSSRTSICFFAVKRVRRSTARALQNKATDVHAPDKTVRIRLTTVLCPLVRPVHTEHI